MRDPKVFAYEGRYYMVLGARTVDDRGEVLVLESTDRLHCMTLPRVLTHDGQGHILQNPAPELIAAGPLWPCRTAQSRPWTSALT